MQIEELPPNKPKFGLIVGLFAATIVVLLLVGVFFIRWDGKHLTMRRVAGQQGSLTMPVFAAPERNLLS